MDVNAITTVPRTALSVTEKPTIPAPSRSPEPSAPTAARSVHGAFVGPRRFQVSLNVDHEANRVVAVITDPKTGEVVQEMPPEQIRNIAKAIRDMLAHVVDETV